MTPEQQVAFVRACLDEVGVGYIDVVWSDGAVTVNAKAGTPKAEVFAIGRAFELLQLARGETPRACAACFVAWAYAEPGEDGCRPVGLCDHYARIGAPEEGQG